MAAWRGEDRGGSLVGQVGEGGGCLHGEVEGEGDGGRSQHINILYALWGSTLQE